MIKARGPRMRERSSLMTIGLPPNLKPWLMHTSRFSGGHAQEDLFQVVSRLMEAGHAHPTADQVGQQSGYRRIVAR